MKRRKLDPAGHLPTLHTAHDVRHLALCRHCNDMGDSRNMIFGRYHGRCYVAKSGLPKFLELPRSQTRKVTLGDIGAVAMRALVDRDAGT